MLANGLSSLDLKTLIQQAGQDQPVCSAARAVLAYRQRAPYMLC